MNKTPSVRVAVIQAASVIMDREATTEKAISLTLKAAKQGAQIVIFPEAFIPAYPRGLNFGTSIGSRSPEGRRDWLRYWENSVPIPSQTTHRLGEAARKAGVYLVMGIIERDQEVSDPGAFCVPILARSSPCDYWFPLIFAVGMRADQRDRAPPSRYPTRDGSIAYKANSEEAT